MKRLKPATVPLSLVAGILVALLAASAMSGPSPKTEEALRRYSALPSEEVRRLQATFDRLESTPEQRAAAEAIHDAVRQDEKLDEQLQLFYAWWVSADPEQRTELQNTPDDEWLDRVRELMAESLKPTGFTIHFPGFRRSGPPGRSRGIDVPLARLEPFFDAVLPDGELSADEQALLNGISPEDHSLARALILADRLIPAGNPRERLPDSQQVEELFDAIAKHLIFQRRRLEPILGERSDPSERTAGKTLVCVATLSGLVDHFEPEFQKRTARSAAELVAAFDGLDPADRQRLMSIDPSVAATTLRRKMAVDQGDEVNAVLAKKLSEFHERIRRVADRRPRDREPIRRPGRPGFGRRDRPNQ